MYHPDKLPQDVSEAGREAAATSFQEVQEAHETLMRVFGWAKGGHDNHDHDEDSGGGEDMDSED